MNERINALRLIGNCLAFVFLFSLALYFIFTNFFIGIMFLLASYDQYEDILSQLKHREIFLINRYVDIIFELILIAFGCIIATFSLLYIIYFKTPLAILMLVSSVLIITSSFDDIYMDLEGYRHEALAKIHRKEELERLKKYIEVYKKK